MNCLSIASNPSSSCSSGGSPRSAEDSCNRRSSRRNTRAAPAPTLLAFCLASSVFLCALLSLIGAAPLPATPTERQRVHVGQLFSLQTGGEEEELQQLVDPERFPTWCRLNQSNGEIYGIPLSTDIGIHLIAVDAKRRVEVEVVNSEQSWPCHDEQASIWIEIFGKRRLLRPEDQYEALKAMQAALVSGGVTGVNIQDWRIFSYDWLNKHYRTISERISPLRETTTATNPAVLVLHLACGELTEQASDIINAVTEAGQNFQIVEGLLRVKPQPASRITEILEEEATELRTIAPIITSVLILILLVVLIFYLFQRWQEGQKLHKDGKKSALDESEAMLSAPSPASGTTGTDVGDGDKSPSTK